MRGLPKGMGVEFSDNRTAQSPVTVLAASINALPETASEGAIAATLSIIGADYVAPASFIIISDPSGFFEIVDDELLVKSGVTFDYETASSHTVTIEGSDGVPNTYSKTVEVPITNINEAPLDISLDATTISEEAEIGDVIATISSSGDPDAGDTATYTITSDPDNKFLISGNELRVNGALDYATATSHNVTVRVTDSGGLFYGELFTIDVTEVVTGFSYTDVPELVFWGNSGNVLLNGSGITQLTDMSSTATHFTQSTISSQPQLVSDAMGPGLPGVVTDASDLVFLAAPSRPLRAVAVSFKVMDTGNLVLASGGTLDDLLVKDFGVSFDGTGTDQGIFSIDGGTFSSSQGNPVNAINAGETYIGWFQFDDEQTVSQMLNRVIPLTAALTRGIIGEILYFDDVPSNEHRDAVIAKLIIDWPK